MVGIIQGTKLKREVAYEEVMDTAKSIGIEYAEIDVKTGHNLRNFIEHSVMLIRDEDLAYYRTKRDLFLKNHTKPLIKGTFTILTGLYAVLIAYDP